MKQALVIGCCGGLGTALVSSLKKQGCKIVGVDLVACTHVDFSIQLQIKNGLKHMYAGVENAIEQGIASAHLAAKFDAIYCVAGGYREGKKNIKFYNIIRLLEGSPLLGKCRITHS